MKMKLFFLLNMALIVTLFSSTSYVFQKPFNGLSYLEHHSNAYASSLGLSDFFNHHSSELMYLNASKLAFLSQDAFSFYHFKMIEANLTGLSLLRITPKKIALALGIKFFNLQGFEETFFAANQQLIRGSTSSYKGLQVSFAASKVFFDRCSLGWRSQLSREVLFGESQMLLDHHLSLTYLDFYNYDIALVFDQLLPYLNQWSGDKKTLYKPLIRTALFKQFNPNFEGTFVYTFSDENIRCGIKYKPYSFIDFMFGFQTFSNVDRLNSEFISVNLGMGLKLKDFYFSLSYAPKTFDVKLPLTKFSIDYIF